MYAHNLTNGALLQIQGNLIQYIKGNIRYSNLGMCANVSITVDTEMVELPRDVLSGFVGAAESRVFPIEGDFKGYVQNRRKHDRRTKYGKLRLVMAKHCLNWVESQIVH